MLKITPGRLEIKSVLDDLIYTFHRGSVEVAEIYCLPEKRMFIAKTKIGPYKGETLESWEEAVQYLENWFEKLLYDMDLIDGKTYIC